jgi:hypothetical protein
MWPIKQDFSAFGLGDTLKVLGNIGEERHQGALIYTCEKDANSFVDKIGPIY